MFVVGDLSPLFQVPTFYVNAINIRHYLSQFVVGDLSPLFQVPTFYVNAINIRHYLSQFVVGDLSPLFQVPTFYVNAINIRHYLSVKATTTNRLLQTDYYKRTTTNGTKYNTTD